MNLAQLKELIAEIEELELPQEIAIEARNASGEFELVRQKDVSLVVGGEPEIKLRIDPSAEQTNG